MIAYKLFRKLKDGSLTSLYINKKEKLPIGVWIEAKEYPTKGFAFRPFWHCVKLPDAPHLSLKNRVWCEVEIEDYEEYKRPKNQGGIWFLSKRLKINKIL
jgi:hypothetical protein